MPPIYALVFFLVSLAVLTAMIDVSFWAWSGQFAPWSALGVAVIVWLGVGGWLERRG